MTSETDALREKLRNADKCTLAECEEVRSATAALLERVDAIKAKLEKLETALWAAESSLAAYSRLLKEEDREYSP